MLELPHVARAAVLRQATERLAADALGRHVVALGELREEVLAEQRDVRRPVAERRQPELDDVEAVEEVLAEAPRSAPGP